MQPSEGFVNSLNKIRQLSSDIYHQYIPEITATTNINEFGQPILTVTEVRNEFMNALIGRIVSVQTLVKRYRNPLQVLEGDNTPFGYAGQEIYNNPAKARRFNVNDFAGLLQKYEAETFVQYLPVNMDTQYCVTVTYDKLRNAFTSWRDLETYVNSLSDTLYNGAAIDEFLYTKALVTSAYKSGRGVVEVINEPTDEDTAKAFIRRARQLYLSFGFPSVNNTSWDKVDPEHRKVMTWANPEDVVFLIRTDIAALIDVDVLASAFNIDRATLLGNIIYVDNFNVYADDRETLNTDGSEIYAVMADKAWFKINTQDAATDQFYNANNRTWQIYFNLTKRYATSLFAKHVIFAKSAPVLQQKAAGTDKVEVTTKK